MDLKNFLQKRLVGILDVPEEGTSPERYIILRRNIRILMLLIAILPLLLMAVINYHEFQRALKDEMVAPLRVLVNKTKHSFEVFLAGRLSTINFVASAYSYDDLADPEKLNRIFRVLKNEFKDFVDLGLIDSKGLQVSYAGPYELKGKTYADQSWFQQVRVNGVYVSEVFLGYRKFPHIVIAVQHMTESGESWILRATIDAATFDNLIAAMGLESQSDAILISRSGVLQTNSKFYGKVLDPYPVSVPPLSYEPDIIDQKDPKGRDIMLAYAFLNNSDFVLIVAKPRAEIFKAWYSLKGELLVLFLASVLLIIFVVLRLTNSLVERMKSSDVKRELAFREMEHSHKLSSIGRLAAGVAHEVNNPMAIIKEKAGLMEDLIQLNPNFPQRDKFLGLVQAITHSVDRCRSITHRLLGFAKRMEVKIEVLDLNEVIKETLGFLEKEALHRNINLQLHLAPDLARIASDRGQLQQVFLNILNNAFAAVKDGGLVSIVSWEKDLDTVGITFQDDGIGMSEETQRHIFEPFFTTKKGQGTGLGMSITHGIVTKLGGDIEVQSKEGQGTRFTIFLPKKAREESS